MRFTSTINNVRLVEWEINITQGALVDLINQASSWAKAVVIDGVTYYWMSFSKVCEELPAVFSKEDTVYRQYKVLKEKGIIDHFKMDGKDYVRLTEKGCEWNKFESIRESEKNPSVGNQSEQGRKKIRESSEKNPTDNNTNYKNNNDKDNPLNPPVGETQGDSVAVLDYLNDRLAELGKAIEQPLPKFKPVPNTLKNIKARLAESSRAECETVVDYLVAKWGRDGKMREYLSPKTIFRASNFADYLPKSTAWAESGKPVAVNGKWMSEAEANRKAQIADMPSVDEVRGVYQRYLSTPTLFNRTDFRDLRKKFVYYCVIKTKNAHPTEHNINSVIAGNIKAVAEQIHDLPIPTLGA
ncbi:conserved phage C-terminal domain-containing protein [Actinobacillus pleuropneumoniae]|uniref:conserved phage C-terminal domain-containing protein n=1 Tax=Actinobacillus pleuropneumoniae TaxID=715 RepID=UPI003CFE5569